MSAHPRAAAPDCRTRDAKPCRCEKRHSDSRLQSQRSFATTRTVSASPTPQLFGLSVSTTGKVVAHEFGTAFAFRRTSGMRRAAQAQTLKSPVNWFTSRSIWAPLFLPAVHFFSEGERHGQQARASQLPTPR